MQQRQNTLNLEMGSCVHPVKVPRQPESTLARVSQQLSHLEKRDWEFGRSSASPVCWSESD
jgi:hypothetical protein